MKAFYSLVALSIILFFGASPPLTPLPNWGGGFGVGRPAIMGVSHIALKTDNLAAAREFYGRILGYGDPTSRSGKDGKELAVYFDVNPHQYIELLPDLENPSADRLSHVAFETADARELRDYFSSRGVSISQDLHPERWGTLTFGVKDPEGHSVEFVQFVGGPGPAQASGPSSPDNRISLRLIHVGLIVRDRSAEDAFYRDILGFREMWHGGRTDDRTDWVDMRVPEGKDWLEYMLNVQNPSPHALGVMHHLALGVPSVDASYRIVIDRGLKADAPRIGRDGKWQLNLYDPNDTRVELMEPKPVRPPCCSPFRED